MKRAFGTLRTKKRASLHTSASECFIKALANASFFIEKVESLCHTKLKRQVFYMRNDKLSVQSMDFAVSIISLVKYLKDSKEHIISNQIGRSGTSIGANIREAQYAHGKAELIENYSK